MEFITLIIIICLFWVWGVVCGWQAREEHARKMTEKFMNQLHESVEEHVEENVISINIEKHNNVFYIYNKHTNEFMAQGSSKEEVENNLKQRFPGKTFGCAEKTLVETGFIS